MQNVGCSLNARKKSNEGQEWKQLQVIILTTTFVVLCRGKKISLGQNTSVDSLKSVSFKEVSFLCFFTIPYIIQYRRSTLVYLFLDFDFNFDLNSKAFATANLNCSLALQKLSG